MLRKSQVVLVDKELLPSDPTRLSVGVAWVREGLCVISVHFCPYFVSVLEAHLEA